MLPRLTSDQQQQGRGQTIYEDRMFSVDEEGQGFIRSLNSNYLSPRK